MSAFEFSEIIKNNLPKLKTGTLRFWGHWFGKPYDNIHTIVECSVDRDSIKLQFENSETLIVTDPIGLSINEDIFSIRDARNVRWEWFYYGRAKTEENRYFMEFDQHDGRIDVSTNVDYYEPKFAPSKLENAVEIL